MKHSLEMNTTDQGAEATLRLWGELSIEHAKDIKTLLLDTLAKSERVQIILGDVNVMDISFLQLICATHIECCELNKQLSVQGDKEMSLDDFFMDGGFCQQLGCLEKFSKTCVMKNICNSNQ